MCLPLCAHDDAETSTTAGLRNFWPACGANQEALGAKRLPAQRKPKSFRAPLPTLGSVIEKLERSCLRKCNPRCLFDGLCRYRRWECFPQPVGAIGLSDIKQMQARETCEADLAVPSPASSCARCRPRLRHYANSRPRSLQALHSIISACACAEKLGNQSRRADLCGRRIWSEENPPKSFQNKVLPRT